MKLSEHFDTAEFACKCCGTAKVEPALIEKLETLRRLAGNLPLTVNSGYRCPRHNKAVGGSPNSQHTLGTAADIRPPTGITVDDFAKLADEAGFTGIGRYKSFVHVDIRPRKARWDYR